jgi:hypothetical protein
MRKSLKLKVLPNNPCEVDFTWYNLIRAELLRKTVRWTERALDVGLDYPSTLLTLRRSRALLFADLRSKSV